MDGKKSLLQIRLSKEEDDAKIHELVNAMHSLVCNRMAWMHLFWRDKWLVKLGILGILIVSYGLSSSIIITSTVCLACILCTWVFIKFVLLSYAYDYVFHEAPCFYQYWNTDEKRGRALWVATLNDKVVGSIALEPVNETTIEMFRVAVDATYKRLGIASQLMKFALNECKKQNKKEVIAGTSCIQFEAHGLYKKFGFDVDKVVKAFQVEIYIFKKNI